MKSKIAPLLLFSAFLLPSVSFGLGIRVVDQDPFATARGDAFTATADNPSAIYYNPAGITQLQGQNLSLGAYGIYLQSKYTPFSGDVTRTKDRPQAVPQIYYTYTFKDYPFTLGLGVYSPYGFSLEYPDNTPFRQLALKGSITYVTINPVAAWKVNDQFSVAAGLTINYAKGDLERGILPIPVNSLQFKGSGYGVGFNLGMMYQPTKQHSFGVSYHSATYIDMEGQSTAVVPTVTYLKQHAGTEFVFPQFIQAGYSFRPTPEWNFEADIDWADWHQLKTLTLNNSLTGPSLLPFNWDSSFIYEFGATRYFGNGFRASAGYIYSQRSMSNNNFNPIVPDTDRNIFSVGLGQTKGAFSWDVAYQLAYGPNRYINNASVIDDGSYRFISHALTFSFGYHF